MRAPTSLRSLGMLSLQMPICTGLCTLTILSPSGKKQSPGLFFIPQPCAPTILKSFGFSEAFLLCRDSNPTGSVLLRKACVPRSPTSLRSLGMLSLQMPVCTGLCTLTILSPSGKKQSPGLFFIPQPCAPTITKASIAEAFLLGILNKFSLNLYL